MLKVEGLKASASGASILKGLDFEVNAGEIHAIMGPNGSGKSTFAKVIAGHPAYEVTGGSISFEGEDVLELEPDERALLGIFLAFQYPVEIPGVTNASFLRTAYNAKMAHLGQDELDPLEFDDLIREKIKIVDMAAHYLDRNVNVGFSGGEKKRNEILQMAVLDPRFAVLDETDSGLDIDALRTVAGGINKLANDDNAVVMVTHYQRLLNYVEPDHVHVMYDGRLVKSGGKELALQLEEQGYDWIIDEVGSAA